MLYSLSFLLAGFNIYASAFFTALNNGLIPAGISFSRTLLFETRLIIALIAGIDGIWFSTGVAELGALILSVGRLAVHQKRYNY